MFSLRYERWARRAHAEAMVARAQGRTVHDFGPELLRRVHELKAELAKLPPLADK